MNAYLEAKKLYTKEEFAATVDYCGTHGAIVCDADVFICAYQTDHRLIVDGLDINEIKSKKRIDKADTWFVLIASGNLVKGFGFFRPLTFLAYERMDGKKRIYEYERYRRLLWEAR